MISCSESYNSIYEDVEEPDPNVVPPGGVDMTKVNILPTFSDPLYSIQGTRDTRVPFENWQEGEEKDHWLKTRFQVFGLRTSSKIGGGANYAAAASGNKQYGVLWNQPMGVINQQGSAQFYDQEGHPIVCRYNPDEKLFRYKFFMLGTDGLESVNLRVENDNRIIAKMTLDGEHDVMQSFAYHTDDQFAREIAQLPSDETTKVFLDGGDNAANNIHMYNRLSGNRGVHPIFNAKHLLSRFDIYVKGGDPDNVKTRDFLKILVKSISIRAAKDVEVVVADDRWERDSYLEQFSSNALIKALSYAPYGLELIANEMRNTKFTQENARGMDFDFLKQDCEKWTEYYGLQSNPIIPEGSHWVGTDERDSLCKSILLPPLPPEGGFFVIDMKYRYLYTHMEDGKLHLGPDVVVPGVTPVRVLYEDYDRVEIPILDDGATVAYEGGKKYSVIITVYGQSVISVDIADLGNWVESDEDINVGGDDVNVE